MPLYFICWKLMMKKALLMRYNIIAKAKHYITAISINMQEK